MTAGVTVKKVDPLSAIDTLSQAHSVAQHHGFILQKKTLLLPLFL